MSSTLIQVIAGGLLLGAILVTVRVLSKLFRRLMLTKLI
jgi:hypothetical protein